MYFNPILRILGDGKMNIYGNELINIGIILIIAAAVLGIISFGIHMALSSKLKKVLEKEYGREKMDGE